MPKKLTEAAQLRRAFEQLTNMDHIDAGEIDEILRRVPVDMSSDVLLNHVVKDNASLFVKATQTIDNQRDEIASLERDRDKYRLALEGLTPGGSEYHNHPELCVKFVKDVCDRQHRVIGKFKMRADSLETRLAEMTERAEKSEGELSYIMGKWLECPTCEDVMPVNGVAMFTKEDPDDD